MKNDKFWREQALCPECESESISYHTETDTFVYGVEDSAEELSVEVPVGRCDACGFEFTDGRAEKLRHEVVCRHLGRLTPKEILEVRERFNLSQAQFAAVTGFGEASIRRWETGNRVQNESTDKYLRLILRLDSLEPLIQMNEDPGAGIAGDRGHQASAFSFRAIEVTPQRIAAADGFDLKPIAA